jgi:signal transduction histidine kinase
MSGTPSVLLHVTQALDLAVIATAVAVLSQQARARHFLATKWALAMFSDLALVVLLGFLPVDDDGSLLRHGYTVLVVSVLLLVPYLLVRFALSLGAVGERTHRVAVALTGVQLAATVVSPPFPEPGEHRSGWFTAYVVLVLVGWTVQSVLAATGLWRAGRGQPSVVRRRMQALGTGAVLLALALVASGASSGASTSVQVATSLAGVAAVCLLVVAFVVPPWLRAAWRSADLMRLGHAERGLMAAVTEQEVASSIVPVVIQLFGAKAGALVDEKGTTITALGTTDAELAQLVRQLRTHPKNEVVVRDEDGWFACRLTTGWLVVRPGSFAPLLGPAEMHLLDRAGSFADLALQRCRLFAEQTRSQRATEATNAELQTLIYSVSHDLRNPIISVLGYVDVLAREHAGQLQGEGEHYLQRISVNALYMQSLIQDLLELSRIGRSEPPAQAVPLGELAESVAHELRTQHPDLAVSVLGSFPVVWMSELRARQLLTNLMDNAAKYGRDGERVIVQAEVTTTGGAVITISDDGRGVPEHLRDKAFDVFERLDAAHTDLPGTGMGLPICRRIVDTVGGSIALCGPASGLSSGTTAVVELPRPVIIGWSDVRALEKEHAR